MSLTLTEFTEAKHILDFHKYFSIYFELIIYELSFVTYFKNSLAILIFIFQNTVTITIILILTIAINKIFLLLNAIFSNQYHMLSSIIFKSYAF